MYLARVYRIMIGCPGDILEEVQIAKDVIIRWTSIHVERDKIVLLPISWDTNSYPEHGAHPQKILNKQLGGKSDMLIGIFGAKIGSPTDTALSGTIEEIEEHIKAGKPVMVFFRQLNDFSHTSSEELAKLESFKSNIKGSVLYREYKDVASFEACFSDTLELFLSDTWLKDKTDDSLMQETAEFSDEEVAILKKWVASKNNTAIVSGMLNGKLYIVGDKTYSVESGREEANWSDFFDRLQEAGFIRFVKWNSQGAPVYELQKRAYDQFDNE